MARQHRFIQSMPTRGETQGRVFKDPLGVTTRRITRFFLFTILASIICLILLQVSL